MTQAERLTEKRIEQLEPGRYSDGGRAGYGLYIRIEPGAGGRMRRRWAQRIRIQGQVTNVGLGSHPIVTLQMARRQALENKRTAWLGGDPRKGDRLNLPLGAAAAAPAPLVVSASVPTFAETADAVIALNAPTWSDPRTAARWRSMLEQHAYPKLGDRPVSTITTADVMATLTPIWTAKAKTAQRVRQRLSKVFQHAIARGHRIDDPAGPQVLAALPKNGNGVQHQAASQHQDVAQQVASIRAGKGGQSAKLALEFTILTAARSVETTGATWGEIDLDAAVWTVPASRYKTRHDHRVPLTPQTLAVLDRAAQHSDSSAPDALIFPGAGGRPLSGVTILRVVKAAGGATTHGYRSAFSSWAAEQGIDREGGEGCLGHVVKGVRGAYQRSDLLERRREIMDRWGAYATP